MNEQAYATVPNFDAGAKDAFCLPGLPYGYADLEPVISEKTLRTHHGKHHARYVETVNRILDAEGRPIEYLADLIRDARQRRATALFNNASQAWNHGFFWESMSPVRTTPGEQLANAIHSDFGSFGALKTRFVTEAAAHFGSGWAWLVLDDSKLSILVTHDAGTPLTHDNMTPLLVCDLWEHAYYLDYQQDRTTWLSKWWDRLANWAFADRQFAAHFNETGWWRYPVAA